MGNELSAEKENSLINDPQIKMADHVTENSKQAAGRGQ